MMGSGGGPVYMTGPAAEAGVEMPEPLPVATNTKPPVPVPTQSAMMGETRQVRVPATTQMVPDEATFTQHMATTTATREVGEAVYTTGPTTEEDGAGQLVVMRSEQLVMGERSQQIVEIPTIQEVVEYQDIPEIMQVEKIMEVEQVVEQIVEVPKIIPQKRLMQRQVDQIVDVPV